MPIPLRPSLAAATGLALAVLATLPAAEGQDALEAIRRCAIEHATVTRLERSESDAFEVAGQPPVKGLPPRTMVRLVLKPEPGSTIAVALWLPDAAHWNGRLLGLGNSGSAGGINERNLAGRVAGGYAVVTTDMGTAPNPASGNGNPAVWRDFGHRATHLMTVAAKQIVRAAYGRDADRCYFVGGSTGGQQAMQAAQRHPEDYDGIVANVPAHCRAPLHAYFLWNHQILARTPFTEAQQKAVIAAANQHVAEREPPATAGRIVSDPRCTPADIAAVIARARSADPSISDAQAEALRQLFDGPRHAVTGERIFNGVPLGSSWNNARGHLYLFHWVFGAQQDLLKLNWNADIDRFLAALGPDLNAEDDDLGRFRDHGGRLLMVSGSADPIVPYHATLDYYERLVERAGSLAAAQAFCRFYLIPGMGHGSEGPGVNTMPDLLALVVDWREKGVAPQALRARRLVDGKTELDLQILPYPGSADGPRGGVDRIAERFRRPPAR